jgi:predicted amidophosphoribosyltransferase
MLTFCSECKAEVSTNAAYCPRCGNPQIKKTLTPEEVRTDDNRRLAAAAQAMWDAQREAKNQGLWQDVKKIFRGEK